MTSYGQCVEDLRDLVEPVHLALESGLRVAAEDHARRTYLRHDEEHFFLHSVRRRTVQELKRENISADIGVHEPGTTAMSAIFVRHKGHAVRVLHSQPSTPGGHDLVVPLPITQARQSFYHQRSLSGLGENNLVLLWGDSDGVLLEPMILVRPLQGDNHAANLRLDWQGPLYRDVSKYRTSDLISLNPDFEYGRLLEESAG